MTLSPSGRIRIDREPSTSLERSVTPPPDGWHEPMHWDPVKRARNQMAPMPKKASGKWYSQAELDQGWAASRHDYEMKAREEARDMMFERMGKGAYPGWQGALG